MNLIAFLVEKIFSVKIWFLKRSIITKLILIGILLGSSWLALSKFHLNKARAPQHQTAQAEKGTLVVSITASGQVSTANSSSISTLASGVVNKIYVTNGQSVKSGDPIAEIDLDLEGKQRSAQASSSYQSAKNTLETAKATMYSLQSDMLTKWKAYMDTAQGSTYQNSDGSPRNDQRQLVPFVTSSDDWLATEAKYKIQQNVINQAQQSLSSAWLSYQQSSPVIYAPISGTVTGLSLQVGSVLVAQSGSTGAVSSQKVANIKTAAPPTVTMNLTEIDAPKVAIGNKATLTMDAFSGKTFTGNVVSIDTVGSVNSGVAIYPTVIAFDTDIPGIFSNMSAQATIMTETKDNVLLIPVSAVQNQNGSSFVRVMKNGNIEQVSVETGLSSDTQIEIASGLSEGDIVVTSAVQAGSIQGRSGQTGSPFGAFGGGAFRGGFGGRTGH